MVSSGADAEVRALDIATRFEEQAFTSTRTRDEYMQLIQNRLRVLQQKKMAMHTGSEGGISPELLQQDPLVLNREKVEGALA